MYVKYTSISLTQWYPPPGKNYVVSYKDSWEIVVNACVNYQKQIFIGVGDINPDQQHFEFFCQFKQKDRNNFSERASVKAVRAF